MPSPPGAKSTKCNGRPIPQFEDVTSKAGIRFTHTSDPSKKYIVESMSGGVILIDYDRDGWPDIYFTNAPTVDKALKGETSLGALYHNNHDGTFTDVTAKSRLDSPCFAMGGAVGDYDNDGWPDLYLTCFGGNVLYHNDGNGTFTDVTKKAGVRDGRWSTGASFGDYDGDGNVDLMVVNYVDLRLNDLPPFGKLPNCKYRGIDVQCGPRGLRGAGDSLFHNNGDGTFTDVSKAAGVDDVPGYFGMGVVWVDFNNSGRPDIYVTNDSSPKYLYKNEGNGKFKEIGLESGTAVNEDGSEQASMGIAVGDYNHTGRPSLYITNFEDEDDLLYRNDGDWNFTDVSYKSGVALPSLRSVKWGDAFADFDNDGWLDIFAVGGHVYPQVDGLPSGGGYRQPKLFYLNQKDGSFCDAADKAGPALAEKRVSRGVAVGDLFNDGNLDIVVEDLDGSPTILRNKGVPGNHWVSFELAGTKSNRLALNAKVKITAGGVTQTDEIHSGGSYLSQNDLRVHFGLGTATKIDSVEVRWPSGKVDTVKDIQADHYYAILEGKGIVSGLSRSH
ncbi:ASPIC/UnbV [Candidatus Koribacter versatilis Ellin345]|uniref:ASPIC/UnbV n=1 Tax=Koribacter versatilis (strain Ellin345) TaxID=204669 RepID=Q1ITH1_KORVE|nr:CRTAC1 family protein [Candidatus Koribacter versatilis]ABF39829.1 ASPIC/UnbV [Candidatus Koribacter versatilis Ellin345]